MGRIEPLTYLYGPPEMAVWRPQLRTGDIARLHEMLASSRRLVLLVAERPDGRFAIGPHGGWTGLSPWPTLPLPPGPVDAADALSTLAAATGWACDPIRYLLAAQLSLRDAQQARLRVEIHAFYMRARSQRGMTATHWVGWHELIGPLRRALWQTPEPLARLAQRLLDATLSQVRIGRREGT